MELLVQYELLKVHTLGVCYTLDWFHGASWQSRRQFIASLWRHTRGLNVQRWLLYTSLEIRWRVTWGWTITCIMKNIWTWDLCIVTQMMPTQRCAILLIINGLCCLWKKRIVSGLILWRSEIQIAHVSWAWKMHVNKQGEEKWHCFGVEVELVLVLLHSSGTPSPTNLFGAFVDHNIVWG